MQVTNLPLRDLRPAIWNANIMGRDDQHRLQSRLERYGLLQNLVVRPAGDQTYEVLSGNQRLQLLQQSGSPSVPALWSTSMTPRHDS